MFSWQKLYKTPTYWIEKIQNDLFAHVEDYLAKTGKSKQEFASDLGVSKGYVSQVLNGHFDHKLSKLVELYLSIGMVPIVIGANLNAYVSALSNGVSKNEFIREICTEEKPKTNNVFIESSKAYYTFNEPTYLNTNDRYEFPFDASFWATRRKPTPPLWFGVGLEIKPSSNLAQFQV